MPFFIRGLWRRVAEGISADVFSCTFEGTLGAPPLLGLSCFFRPPPPHPSHPPHPSLESRSERDGAAAWGNQKNKCKPQAEKRIPVLQSPEPDRENKERPKRKCKAKLSYTQPSLNLEREFFKSPILQNNFIVPPPPFFFTPFTCSSF